MHGRPLACLVTDLAKFYDTVQIDVLEVVLKLEHALPAATQLVRAMYHNSTLRIACCPFGDSESCVACLLVLEPYHRLQEAQPATSGRTLGFWGIWRARASAPLQSAQRDKTSSNVRKEQFQHKEITARPLTRVLFYNVLLVFLSIRS